MVVNKESEFFYDLKLINKFNNSPIVYTFEKEFKKLKNNET